MKYETIEFNFICNLQITNKVKLGDIIKKILKFMKNIEDRERYNFQKQNV